MFLGGCDDPAVVCSALPPSGYKCFCVGASAKYSFFIVPRGTSALKRKSTKRASFRRRFTHKRGAVQGIHEYSSTPVVNTHGYPALCRSRIGPHGLSVLQRVLFLRCSTWNTLQLDDDPTLFFNPRFVAMDLSNFELSPKLRVLKAFPLFFPLRPFQ